MEKIIDLRKAGKDKLFEKLVRTRKKLIDKKLMFVSGKEKDTSVFAKYRRSIARIITVLKEKEVLYGQKNS